MSAFETMPLVAVVNHTYLCMHGGISPLLKSLDDVNQINRFEEIPDQGLLCDLVWADPINDEIAAKYDFTDNAERSCSVKYGLKPTKRFLEKNDFTLLVRGHQV